MWRERGRRLRDDTRPRWTCLGRAYSESYRYSSMYTYVDVETLYIPHTCNQGSPFQRKWGAFWCDSSPQYSVYTLPTELPSTYTCTCSSAGLAKSHLQSNTSKAKHLNLINWPIGGFRSMKEQISKVMQGTFFPPCHRVVPSVDSSVWYSDDGHISHSHHHTLQPLTLHSTLLTACTAHSNQGAAAGGRDKSTATRFVLRN